MLQKKPDRKELKGKVPTQNMYKNCNEAPRQDVRDMRLKVTLLRGSTLDYTYLDRRGEQGINDESIDDLWYNKKKWSRNDSSISCGRAAWHYCNLLMVMRVIMMPTCVMQLTLILTGVFLYSDLKLFSIRLEVFVKSCSLS